MPKISQPNLPTKYKFYGLARLNHTLTPPAGPKFQYLRAKVGAFLEALEAETFERHGLIDTPLSVGIGRATWACATILTVAKFIRCDPRLRTPDRLLDLCNETVIRLFELGQRAWQELDKTVKGMGLSVARPGQWLAAAEHETAVSAASGRAGRYAGGRVTGTEVEGGVAFPFPPWPKPPHPLSIGPWIFGLGNYPLSGAAGETPGAEGAGPKD